MSKAIWLVIVTALSLAGMAWLALGMEVQWGQVMHRPAEQAASTRRVLRAQGALALRWLWPVQH